MPCVATWRFDVAGFFNNILLEAVGVESWSRDTAQGECPGGVYDPDVEIEREVRTSLLRLICARAVLITIEHGGPDKRQARRPPHEPRGFYRDVPAAITQQLRDVFAGLHGTEPQTTGLDLRQMRRRPLGAQSDAIRAVAVSLQRHRGTNLVGEMGTGKTTIGTAAAYLAGFSSVLVLCPPHLVRKWQREVVATVPFVRTAIVTSISDLHRLRASEGAPLFVILSRERAKLSYRWLPTVIERLVVRDGRLIRGEDGEPVRHLCCSACSPRY